MGHTKVLVELSDERGNVTVIVDSGARFSGTLRTVPDDIRAGDLLDIMLIFDAEPGALVVTCLEDASHITVIGRGAPTNSMGLSVRAEVVSLDLGGIALVPPGLPIRVSGTAVGLTPIRSAEGVVPAPISLAEQKAIEHTPVRLNVETPGLRGRLHEVPFAEVVQLLCAAKRTATVEFTSGFALMGILGFQDGRCIYAAGMERAGQDAFFALATVVDGEFAVYYGKKAPNGDNISGDTLYLLLEVARRTDEERRDSLPPLPAAPTIDEVAAAVDAAIAGGPPPLPHPRRRKTDRPPFASQLETTQPGRHLKQTGMFSAFFDEYSSARERLREASVPPGKMAVLSSEAPKKRSKTKTKVKALPAEKPMAQPAPPFVSVALAGDKASEAAAGESDTDIIKDGGFVSAS